MKLEKLKDCRLLCFAAGAAAVPVLKKLLKSEKTRKACVSGIAKGMKLYQEAQETVLNIKEDAEDLCYEAKSSLNNKAEEADSDEV